MYKVGDKVKVKNKEEILHDNGIEDIEEHYGKIYIILEISEKYIRLNTQEISYVNRWFKEDMIIPYDDGIFHIV